MVERTADNKTLTLAEYTYTSTGAPLTVKEYDLIGNVTTTTFDVLERPFEVTTGGETDRYEYDENNELAAICKNASATTCKHKLEVSWNAAHTEQVIESAAGSPSGFCERHTLDQALRERKLERGFSATDIGLTQQRTFDIDGREVSVTASVKNGVGSLSLSEQRTYTESAGARGALATVTAEGASGTAAGEVSYGYDARGRVATISRTGELFPGEPLSIYGFEEDESRFLKALQEIVIDSDGTSGTEDVFDGFGRKSETNRLADDNYASPAADFTYSAGGNVQVREVVISASRPGAEPIVDEVRKTVSLTIDGRGRVVFERRPDCLGGECYGAQTTGVVVTTRWDGANKVKATTSSFTGALVSTSEWEHDDDGRVLKESLASSIVGQSYSRLWHWQNGRVVDVRDVSPDALFAIQHFDGRGHLVKVEGMSGTTTIERNALSDVERVVHEDGSTEQTRRYPDGRILSQTVPDGSLVVFAYGAHAISGKPSIRTVTVPDGAVLYEPTRCADGEVAAADLHAADASFDLSSVLFELVAEPVTTSRISVPEAPSAHQRGEECCRERDVEEVPRLLVLAGQGWRSASGCRQGNEGDERPRQGSHEPLLRTEPRRRHQEAGSVPARLEGLFQTCRDARSFPSS